MKRVVIVGGGYAGLMCAIRLARKVKGLPVSVTLVDGRDKFFEKIRLHQRAVMARSFAHDFSRLLKGTSVNFVQGWASLDVTQREVRVGDEVLSYDYLVLAVGGESSSETTYSLSSEGAADLLRCRLVDCADSNGRVVVAGAGMSGIELAAEVAEVFPTLSVTLVTSGRLMSDFSQNAIARVRRTFSDLGVMVKEDARVDQFCDTHLVLANGEVLPADMTISTLGFRISTVAKDAGLKVDDDNRALVDANLRSLSHANVFCIGDAANAGLRMGCVTALPMGAYVADHLASCLRGNAEEELFDFAFMMRCVSLGRREGLIQFVSAEDEPNPRILGGRLASIVKEFVCRSVLWVLSLERWFSVYRWPKRHKPEQQLGYGRTKSTR